MNDLQFSPYQLPQGSNNPQAFNQDFFNTVQKTLGSEYQDQANGLENFQSQHNIGNVGGSTSLLQQVLGSPQMSINSQIMPTALHASSVGAGQQFQTKMQQLQFQQQLQQMQQQYEEQASLMTLYAQLMPHGYSPSFGQTLGTGVASAIGQSPATAAKILEAAMGGGGGGGG